MSLGAYTEHEIQKQAALAEYAAELIEVNSITPMLFTREGIEKFRGKPGDKITKRVRGRLPYRKYDFRNDRTNPIIFDIYSEAATDITWGDRVYQGVRITDEQADFDLDSWEPVLTAQAEAIAVGIGNDMIETIESAPFEVTIGGAGKALRAAIIEARRVMGKLRVPGQRHMIIDSDFEAALLEDKDLTLAKNVGDGRAESALGEASLGKLLGFSIFVDPTLPSGTAIAAVPSAFVQVSGAAALPRGGVAASVGSASGTSVRWIADYAQSTFENRSTVDTYVGSAAVRDLFFPKSVLTSSATPVDLGVGDMVPHFVRAIKLTLDGDSAYPAANTANAGLIAETGISAANAWNADDHVATP